MFWDKIILLKYQIKSEVCALEICFRDEERNYYYAHLRNKNKKIELVATGSCDDLNSIPEGILKNKIPVAIVINGKGLILKKITLNENHDPRIEEIIRENLPALNLDDFYAQLYKQNDGSAFIALCRKVQVDEIISGLKLKKYDLAGVFLGTPSIIGLQPVWTNYNSIRTSMHQVELSNNVLDSLNILIDKKNEQVKIDSINFESDYTLGFASGLSYLMRREIAEDHSDNLLLIRKKHVEKNKFNFLMILCVGIAFFLSILNVIFYTTYFDKNNKLETELSVYQGKYEQINQLLEDYQKNKNLIENAGVLNRNKLSEYADKIGKTLPDEVILSELYFNPKKDDDLSEDSLLTFQNKSLVLKGNCSKSFIVNEWISVLKMQQFIKTVSLEKFIYNNQGLLPNFEIKLTTE